MSSLELLSRLVFMRQGYGKGKGQGAVKVQARDIFQYYEMLSLWKKTGLWQPDNLSCFWRQGQLPAQDYSSQSLPWCPCAHQSARKEVKYACFHWAKTQAKMDDNSSIVALSHILDGHIMRIWYCFPLLLWSCLNTKFILHKRALQSRSRSNQMLESDFRVQECYTKGICRKFLKANALNSLM